MHVSMKQKFTVKGKRAAKKMSTREKVEIPPVDNNLLPHCPVCLQVFKISLNSRTNTTKYRGFKLHLNWSEQCSFIIGASGLAVEPIWLEQLNRGEVLRFKQMAWKFHPQARMLKAAKETKLCNTNKAEGSEVGESYDQLEVDDESTIYMQIDEHPMKLRSSGTWEKLSSSSSSSLSSDDEEYFHLSVSTDDEADNTTDSIVTQATHDSIVSSVDDDSSLISDERESHNSGMHLY